MKVLVVAPHPFYQERGTPIAVKMLVETLCDWGISVDLLTYHEGTDISYPRLKIFRIARPPLIKDVPIGFSWKKLICDFYLSVYLMQLIVRKNYQIIHAVEESIFPSLIIKKIFKKKLIYDMDSSLMEQLVEKWKALKSIGWILDKLERFAIKQSDLVLPVCKALADKVSLIAPQKKVFILHDVSFESPRIPNIENVKERLKLKGLVGLYIGNLEYYQGIDLMLQGIAALHPMDGFDLVVIGGNDAHIRKYRLMCEQLGIQKQVHFIGPRPLKYLSAYLSQADILISPRIKGSNTPMKIYSYLASGKPILATRIESHTQVLDDHHAVLVDLHPGDFALGFKKLIRDPVLRKRLGMAGKAMVEENYSVSKYKDKLLSAYNCLVEQTI